MLTDLFSYLGSQYDFPGSGLFDFLSFKAGISFVFSLLFALIFGKKLIGFLRKKQMGEIVRDLGLAGQVEKAGTPTMGGLIIIFATLFSVVLFNDLSNIYILLLIVTTIWMGSIGLLDDYLKKYKKNKDGLSGKYKIIGQIGLGIIVGSVLYFNDDVVIKEEVRSVATELTAECEDCRALPTFSEPTKSIKSNVPFMKNNEIDYSLITKSIGLDDSYSWVFYIPFVIFLIAAVSNGANLTDGIDGLAGGASAIIVLTLGLFAWLSGNIIAADYLDVFYIPNSGEIVVFCSALTGALIGFLWYNTFPAQVFMGDTGSLTIGGIIAVVAIIIRKELLIPILCGVFFAESLSVILQVSWFKWTKKRTGEGRRIFLMSPLHHHFQKKGIHESKIVIRFLIIGILLAAMSVITLKIR